MAVKNDPTCKDCCDNERMAVHILCKCEAYSAYRFEHLGQHLFKPWELYDVPAHCLLK